MVVTTRKKKSGLVPVYLNVYDLTPINGFTYWFGLGIHHSGVQVHGIEYSFRGHVRSTTGVYKVEPKQSPYSTFRKSILIGGTDLGPEEVHDFMQKLKEEYGGNTYRLFSKNCNDFSNDMCVRLTGTPIPRWVNRLSRFVINWNLDFGRNPQGCSLIRSVLQGRHNERKAWRVRSEEEKMPEGERKKLRDCRSKVADNYCYCYCYI